MNLGLLRRGSQPTRAGAFTITRQTGALQGQTARASKGSAGRDESLLGRQEILPG